MRAVNPGQTDANITLLLRDGEGRVVATGHGSLAAGRHYAGILTDLSGLDPDFAFPADFTTTTHFGSLAIESDQPLSVLALRSALNQRATRC